MAKQTNLYPKASSHMKATLLPSVKHAIHFAASYCYFSALDSVLTRQTFLLQRILQKSHRGQSCGFYTTRRQAQRRQHKKLM
jgi:hypothetical protein